MTGFVYFIAAPAVSHVKIGFSKNPDGRLRELQTASGHALVLLGTIAGTRADEQVWHKQFAAKRLHGEWFGLDLELQAVIRAATDGLGPCEALSAMIDERVHLAADISDTFNMAAQHGFNLQGIQAVLSARKIDRESGREPRSIHRAYANATGAN